MGGDTDDALKTLEKFDSSFVSQWAVNDIDLRVLRVLEMPSGGNIVACGTDIGGNVGRVAAWDTSGALQWKTNPFVAGGNVLADVGVDSSDNVYVVAGNLSSDKVIKLNSGGTVQWRVTTTGISFASCISVDTVTDEIIVGGFSTGTKVGAIEKLAAADGATVWTTEMDFRPNAVGIAQGDD